MKTSGAIRIACMAFTLMAGPLAAQEDADNRKEMVDEANKRIASLELKEIPANSLGEWKNAIHSSLFSLFRRTELFRGPIRMLVIDESSVVARLYPDGTFVISSGLLDYIDQSLFEETADSPRRIRNFEAEREAAIIPFLAPEASHFALGHQLAAWNRSRGSGMEFTDGENLDADRFASVLLKLAGLDSGAMEKNLASLSKKISGGTLGPAFTDYFSSLPSPEKRLAALRGAAEDIDRVAGEFGIALDALKRGSSYREASDELAALAEKFPESSYVARLSAIVAHLRWLETVNEQDQAVPTFLPFAQETTPDRQAFMAIAGDASASAGFPQEPAISAASPLHGDAFLFNAADTAYRTALALLDEPGLSSSYAMLAARGGDADSMRNALELASAAAIREAGTRSFTARANYANLLFLTGTDYAKAQYFMATLGAVAKASDARFLDTGVPGDSRDIILSQALMMRALGDSKLAAHKITALAPLYGQNRDEGTINLRHLRVGDAPDDLAEKWGRPASIVYNYPTETWEYPALSASAIIEGKVSRVRIFPGSPLSPGFDIRTGDSRSDFESMFGKASYRAGDCDVYIKDGNRISVLYLADRIRIMTIGL
jgi:hypothetical protein